MQGIGLDQPHSPLVNIPSLMIPLHFELLIPLPLQVSSLSDLVLKVTQKHPLKIYQ